MVRLAELISYASLFAVCIAAPDDATKNRQGLTKVSPNSGLNSRSLSPRSLLQKRCQGTCEECFGAGYTECPGSDYYCYLPGDAEYGIDSCSSTGSSYASTTAAASPTTTGSAGNSDYCSGPDATCVTCFGPGYLQCSDGISCYNPDDPNYDTCPDGSGSGSGTTSCEAQYGSGSEPCGSDACYNPGEGETCCADGYHCTSGQTCSSTIGKCCNSGSTNSGCTGSSVLLTSSSYDTYTATYSSYSYSSYEYSSYTSSYTFPTTTEDTFSTAVATSATTSGSNLIADTNDAGSILKSLEVMGVVIAAFGAGLILL